MGSRTLACAPKTTFKNRKRAHEMISKHEEVVASIISRADELVPRRGKNLGSPGDGGARFKQEGHRPTTV